jgi:acetyl-CoA acetyltransferase
MFSQFTGAEMIARNTASRKEELDEFAYDSHRKARRATEAGAFETRSCRCRSPAPTATTDTHT